MDAQRKIYFLKGGGNVIYTYMVSAGSIEDQVYLSSS